VEGNMAKETAETSKKAPKKKKIMIFDQDKKGE